MKTRLTHPLTAHLPSSEAGDARAMEPTASISGSSAPPSAPAERSRRRRMPRRRTAAALTLALATAGAGVVMADPALASWYPASVGSSGVNVRDCYHPTVHLPPSTSCTYQAALGAGTGIHIVCQRAGQNINGDNVWDYVTYSGGEGYAADYYIYTGYSSWIPGIDICQ